MYTGKKLITALSFVIMLLFPVLSFAMPDSGETVTRRGTVDDDYYAAGGTVDINAIISGDVVTAGGELYIGHHVKGDVIAAGGSIQLRGDVLDDVRMAGGDISIEADIGDDLIASGGRINVSAGAIVGGEAWLAGGDVRVAGTVTKDLVVAAGSVSISGTVHGNVMIEAGEVHILEGAVIDGDLHYRSPAKASIHASAKINGEIEYEQVVWDHSHGGTGIFFVITMIAASFALYKLFPAFTLSAAGRISADPLKSMGAGLVILIIAPFAAALLVGIVLGIWIGLSIMAFYLVALITGFLVACFYAGEAVAKRFNKDVSTTGRRFISVALTITILGLLKNIPVIGGLLIFLLLLSGLGAVTLQLRDLYSESANK
jgi:cytoskeletal protein CcmA (bactofilin family)/uncharacterized membrane protein